MLKAGVGAVRQRVMQGVLIDPDVVAYAARVTVWGRWFIWAFSIYLMAYRPGFWFPQDAEYLVVHGSLGLHNGLVHYRLLTHRPVTWRWMLVLCAMDVALITASIVIFGGFRSFIFLCYYPAITIFAVVFSSSWLSFVWAMIAAVTYTAVCLAAGSGLDIDAGDDRGLMARLAAMYFIAMGVSFITRFERTRWRNAVTKERHLRLERIDLSQTIHDTAAQTAYMIGMGIHRARQLAGESNEELVAALDATADLSRSAMWEMRGPIDAGHIVEGRELGRVLWSHCATFEKITGVPAEMLQSGAEPPIATETRTGLFTIAHNALTNVFLHARPSRVEVRLSFQANRMILSVSDDGVGLPDDYAERGRGFNGMRVEAAKMGGTLIVESVAGGGGTTITCVVPQEGG